MKHEAAWSAVIRPGGTFDNSPAIYCWVLGFIAGKLVFPQFPKDFFRKARKMLATLFVFGYTHRNDWVGRVAWIMPLPRRLDGRFSWLSGRDRPI
jgi:hypothetical protein